MHLGACIFAVLVPPFGYKVKFDSRFKIADSRLTSTDSFSTSILHEELAIVFQPIIRNRFQSVINAGLIPCV